MKAMCAAAAAGFLVVGAHCAVAEDGAAKFAEVCEACHQAGGVGAPGVAPPLVSPILANAAARQPDYPARVITTGLSGLLPLANGETIVSAMPPQRQLSDEQVAAVVSYVFGLNGAKVSLAPAEVARVRAEPIGNAELKKLRAGLMP